MIISGYSYVSPTHEVKRLAKDIGMEGELSFHSFAIYLSQVTEKLNPVKLH
jgi:hypothetical protein